MPGVAAGAALLAALLLASPLAASAAGAAADTVPAQAGAGIAADGALAQAGAGGQRRVLRVGPQRELRAPSYAARLAQDGDLVEIDPGVYRDCTSWTANNLLIRSPRAYAHMRGVTCEGRGIWIIRGRNTTVENVEFSHASVPEKNGAGIFQVGVNLTVRNSFFHDNENGILTGAHADSQITIANSRFERNGKCQPDCAHGIYVGRVKALRVFGSSFREQHIAHHIKSRALYTEITGTVIDDGATGTASFAINLPNGGTAVIRQNSIRKGPAAHNHAAVISIGEEGATNPGTGFRIEGNVFRNDNAGETVFVRNATGLAAVLAGNTYQGKGRPLSGPGSVDR